jgi:hypothetical protein
MQNKVIFNDGQDVDPSDFNNLQTYAQTSIDTLVADAVSSNQRYAGLTVTKTAATSVGIDIGRLYSNGKVYAYGSVTTQDFLSNLPVAGNKIVTVVAYGTEVDTDVTPREFLINETTGQSQPKPVATRHARVCNVSFAYGVEAPSPVAPIISAGYTAIADILLTPTGVSTITMRSDNAVTSLDGVDNRLDDLEEFEGQIGPKVTTLSSDLASLSQKLNGQVSTQVLGQLLVRVAALESKNGIPSTNVSSHADYFLDASKLDLANPLSSCTQNEGIRFPLANANQSQLALFNPLDVNAHLDTSGLLLPSYTRKLWLSTGSQSDQVRISGYSYQTNALVQKTMTQQVTQYGAAFDVCTNSAFWQSGTYNPITGIFTAPGGATFNAALDLNGLPYLYSGDGYMHTPVRLQQFWTDSVTVPYWDTVTTTHNVNGAFIAESFLQGQDIWLDAVGLYFTQLADTGDATIAILEVSNATGLPDMTSAISVTSLPRASMQIAPKETVVSITPTFLQAGKRYAVAIVTAADHWVATVPGESFTSGTFFYILDGAYAQGDGTKDLQMNLYRAVPKSNRTSIQLNPLSLNGGILGIQVYAQTWVPSNCTLSYEIQVNGNWYALSDVTEYTLGQGGAVLPLLPLRVTFVGSSDMMPAVMLSGSVVKVTRPDVVAKAFTLPVQVPSTSQIRVIQRYENWDSVYHTATIKLRTGGVYATAQGSSSSYTTVVNPSSYTDVAGTDPVAGKYIERTYVFNLGAAVTSFVIETDLNTSTNLKQFHVAFSKDYEL